jgi:hypothetical protein
MKKTVFLAISLAFAMGLHAQHNEEVTIEGSYRPKVNKVDKIVLKPDTPEQSFTMPESEVKVLDIEHRFRLNLEKFSPLSYNSKNVPGEDVANNFLMAGFGSRISPVFLYRHNSNLSKDFGLSVGLKHYSSWLDIKDYAPSGFMNNAVEIGVSDGDLGGNQLVGKVYYKNDVYHYYGVNTKDWPWDQTSLEHAAPQQIYNTIGTHWGWAPTTVRRGELTHDVGLDYHYLFGQVGNGQEHSARLNYELGYADNLWGKKNNLQKMGVAFGAQYGFNDLLEQQISNRLLVSLNPYFEMNGDFYRLHLGVKGDVATKFETEEGAFRVYPDLKGNLFVLNNALEFYAGLNGGRKCYTYSDLIAENPFVSTCPQMEMTNVKLGFEGGIRTNILHTVDVHVGVRYRHTDNDYFFSQRIDTAYLGMTVDRPYNSFDVIYDETRLVSVLGNVRWLVTDGLTVDAGVTYNKCDPTNEAHAWYRPTMEGSLNVDYQLLDGLLLNASFLYQGGRWAQTGATADAPARSFQLSDAYDLGLGAEYRLRENFSVFVKADNLLNRKYQYYLDYPVAGIEAFAGLKLTF